jgi:predicted HD phosphohydrolase
MRATDILERYRLRGGLAYEGEGVTQLQHAWQSGQLAKRSAAAPELQLAAWLHDLGHLVSDIEGTPTLAGVDDRHEALGAVVLLRAFGLEVSGPVALHVDAKRFLVACRPGYADLLSPDSRRSLALQGGPMGPTAWMQFAKTCFAADAVRLRVWDDHAKVASLQPVSTEAALSELARLMDAVSERGG